jgi:hypothetical protein
MDWKRTASIAVAAAYGLGTIYSDHHFGPMHIGPGTANVVMASGSSTVGPASAFVISSLHHVSVTSDFEYEATRSSAPLKNDGVTGPLFQCSET